MSWSHYEIISNILVSPSPYLFPSLVVSVLLSVSVAAECYMVLSSEVAVISSCSLYQLSSLPQDHDCQLILCIPMLLFKSCSSMFLCTILGIYISAVQGCDVTSEAAVFILMSSLHPLSGHGILLSNSLMLRNF